MYWIAGCDEVGRGALAGPLVAAAVLVRQDQPKPRWLPSHKDSKLLTKAQRQDIFNRAAGNFLWSVSWVEAKDIDCIGVQTANKRAVLQAVSLLPFTPNKLMVDYIAGFTSNLPFELFKHGDRDYWPIALASIMAKVYRDQLMNYLHNYWPEYGFNKHVGYGTNYHQQTINKKGLISLHRHSFVHPQLTLPHFIK